MTASEPQIAPASPQTTGYSVLVSLLNCGVHVRIQGFQCMPSAGWDYSSFVFLGIGVLLVELKLGYFIAVIKISSFFFFERSQQTTLKYKGS